MFFNVGGDLKWNIQKQKVALLCDLTELLIDQVPVGLFVGPRLLQTCTMRLDHRDVIYGLDGQLTRVLFLISSKKISKLFQIIRDIGNVIRRFTGNPSVPDPDDLIRQCWTQDPFTLGAYSYPRIVSGLKVFKQMGEPLPSKNNPRILFAGSQPIC